jgi:hypothetical protein
MTETVKVLTRAALTVFTLSVWCPLVAFAQISVDAPTVVSVSPTGAASEGGASVLPVAGPNGDGLAFESAASNLVPGDTNGVNDAYFRDPATKLLKRASVSTGGVEGDGNSTSPSISRVLPDGFYALAFQSRASNLGSITNTAQNPNIYVRFPTLGITELISVGQGFTLPNGDSYSPSIAVVPDTAGRNKVLIAFASTATDLVAGDPDDGVVDIFLATLTAPTSSSYTPATLTSITRITKSVIAGQDADGSSATPLISADGRYIVFGSRATNLVSPPIENSNFDQQIYRHDLVTGETILVSKSAAGIPGDSDSLYCQLSYTGRFIAYFTFAKNIVGNATERPLFPFVVRYDALTNTSQQVNLAADGVTSGLGQLLALGISANGRLITFGDASGNLVPSGGGSGDVYLKDMETGQVAKLSVGPQGQQSNQFSSNPTLTARSLNGLSFAVAFESLATNLVNSPQVSGMGDLFTTGFTIGAPALSTNTILETPPDIGLARKRVTVTAQKFVLASPTASRSSGDPAMLAAVPKRAIKYEFEILRTTMTKSGKSKTSREKSVDRRNQVTAKRTPGSYQVRSRVQVVNAKSGRVISRTPFSPVQNFTIR